MSDARLPDVPLLPFPEQATGVPWPTAEWPVGTLPSGVELGALMEEAFDPDGPLHDTYAVVAVHGGELVYERYGGVLPRFDGPGRPVLPDTPLLSWSVAKSVLHAVVGLLVGDGRFKPSAPVTVPEWSDRDDPRGAITLEDLLEMRDGLAFVEDYVDAQVSDVIEMLFGDGQDDMARFAADRPLAATPGSRYNYSTGTSMVISGIVAREVGAGDPYRTYLEGRLFAPLGMDSASPGFDTAGSWVAGSYLHATARDFAKFGLLYLRDGWWDGERLLPEGWVDLGRRGRSVDPDDGNLYGAHWWTRGDPLGTFWAAGHDGQFIDVCPALDLVLVRLGRTDSDRSTALQDWRDDVIRAFEAGVGGVGST